MLFRSALGWGVFKEAQAAADSAWALGKQDLACATVRIRAYLAEADSLLVGHHYGSSMLSPGFNGDGKPNGPAPPEEQVQAEISRLSEKFPLLRTYKVVPSQWAKTINYVSADRLPTRESIDRARHTLTLYQEFSRSAAGGAAKISKDNYHNNGWHNSEWYQLGLDNLVSASKVLQSFYFASATVRQDSADKLAELRVQTRAVAEMILQTPSVRDSYFVGDRIATRDELAYTVGSYDGREGNIFGCQMNWGGFWQERPEDVIEMYRRLMSSPVFCYLHGALWSRDLLQPRLVAWRDDDYQRLHERGVAEDSRQRYRRHRARCVHTRRD